MFSLFPYLSALFNCHHFHYCLIAITFTVYIQDESRTKHFPDNISVITVVKKIFLRWCRLSSPRFLRIHFFKCILTNQILPTHFTKEFYLKILTMAFNNSFSNTFYDRILTRNFCQHILPIFLMGFY